MRSSSGEFPEQLSSIPSKPARRFAKLWLRGGTALNINQSHKSMKSKTPLAISLLLGLIPLVAFADYASDKKKYDECVKKVKKDYPVPNGNVNTQRQLIQQECGNPPTPPKK